MMEGNKRLVDPGFQFKGQTVKYIDVLLPESGF